MNNLYLGLVVILGVISAGILVALVHHAWWH